MERQPRVGLMVGRFQPLHNGHTKTISLMIQDCETAIICLGSAQKSGELHDPWTVEERMQMLKNVYGDRIKIVPLNDLNAVTPEEWTNYIFDKLKKLGMPEPTEYYTGSRHDYCWYEHCFSLCWLELEDKYKNSSLMSNIDVIDKAYAVSYNGGSNERFSVFRRAHLIDRNMNPVPSATEIRGFLQLRTDRWKEWVPAVNHDLVEKTYPEEFKVPIK